MTAKVEFKPPLQDIMGDLQEAIMSAAQVDQVIWFEVEKYILLLQQGLWGDIAGTPKKESTKRKYRWHIEHGVPAFVGADGRTEQVTYVDEGGHRTGFLDERLTSSDRMPPYNLPMFDRSGDVTRYAFGIDVDAFYNQYPFLLAEWLEGKISSDTIANLINIGDKEIDRICEFLFDQIWQAVEARLRD
jgi:hypothetical protein